MIKLLWRISSFYSGFALQIDLRENPAYVSPRKPFYARMFTVILLALKTETNHDAYHLGNKLLYIDIDISVYIYIPICISDRILYSNY